MIMLLRIGEKILAIHAQIFSVIYTLCDAVTILLPSAMGFLVFLEPCQPPLLGSIILPPRSAFCLPDLGRKTATVTLVRLGLATFEFVILLYITVIAIFYVIYVLLGGIIFLWEECTHVFGRSTAAFVEYRKLHVLEKLLNSCIRHRIFPMIAFFCPVVQILSSYLLVELHGHVNWSQLILFSTVFLDVLMLNVTIFSGCATVFKRSRRWLAKVKGEKMSKMNKKMLVSMIPLRVWFGESFIDGITPLVIQEFCSLQTMNLLLLKLRN